MRRTLSSLLVVIAGVLFAAAGTAHAGGWAVVALDPLEQSPTEGQPLAVGFTILQHGVAPYTTGNAFIIVTDATGRSERFDAKPEGEPGHHIAQVTFPDSGLYRWEVRPDWFAKQSLGEINVATDTSTPLATSTTTTSTTTTVREPFALALRIMLAVALAIAGATAIAELVTTRRRATA
ncbi:MAG TPA: hypothetical protein VM282_03275 [Acidimicrobiales bacterium]|nr:hypothetical protein [Acidimicrobiales bacterium]